MSDHKKEAKNTENKPNSAIPMANPSGPAVVKRDIDAELRKAWEKDKTPVRGMFKFHECPGGVFEFSYRKYKWDDVRTFFQKDGTALVDGEVYTLPLGIAKHLNKNCWYPVHKYLEDEEGKKSIQVGKKVQRVSFQSLEFTDMNDQDLQPTPDLVTVSQISI